MCPSWRVARDRATRGPGPAGRRQRERPASRHESGRSLAELPGLAGPQLARLGDRLECDDVTERGAQAGFQAGRVAAEHPGRDPPARLLME